VSPVGSSKSFVEITVRIGGALENQVPTVGSLGLGEVIFLVLKPEVSHAHF